MTKHPAKFSPAIMDRLQHIVEAERKRLGREPSILDPFAGTGRVHALGMYTIGIELEPEWADMHPRTIQGDALGVMGEMGEMGELYEGWFDMVVTSPAYGNRLADRIGGNRITYQASLGRRLSEGNAGAMQWGKAYREFHAEAWRLAARLIRPGGLMVVNVKDHYRNGARQDVAAWHSATLSALGLSRVSTEPVKTSGVGRGANTARTAALPEYILQFRKVGTDVS